MNVFIDTNVFLSFYHLTSEDLEELEKLVLLIKKNELNLFLPEQVIDETRRNRASKINDGFSLFKKSSFKISCPVYCKDYGQYREMRASLQTAEKYHAEMVALIQKDIESKALKADLLIESLFEIAQKIPRTPEIIKSAIERVNLGNPPGKKDSLGDAINWESVLVASPFKRALYLITDDSDFYSLLSPNKFNDFLQTEWTSKKQSSLFFYRKLSDFFKSKFPNINLKTELEKDKLIEDLSASANFAETHSLIAKLSSYDGFGQKQQEDLVRALLNNNQIRWILSDEDVYDFYSKLDKNSLLIFEDFYDEFQEALNGANQKMKMIFLSR